MNTGGAGVDDAAYPSEHFQLVVSRLRSRSGTYGTRPCVISSRGVVKDRVDDEGRRIRAGRGSAVLEKLANAYIQFTKLIVCSLRLISTTDPVILRRNTSLWKESRETKLMPFFTLFASSCVNGMKWVDLRWPGCGFRDKYMRITENIRLNRKNNSKDLWETLNSELKLFSYAFHALVTMEKSAVSFTEDKISTITTLKYEKFEQWWNSYIMLA
jgi:hypothetical protein